MRVSEHCWAVTGLACLPPWMVNAGFIAGSLRTLVIDTGCNAAAAATIHGYASLARPGNRWMVLNTEKHFDHIGGNAFFRDCGAELYGHPGVQRTEAEFLGEIAEYNDAIPDPARRARREAEAFYAGTRLAMPDHPITAATTFDLGGLEAQVIPTPGHTPTNLSVFAEGVLYTGDCLVNLYAPNVATADVPAWLDSLDRLEGLHAEAAVPGHGAVVRGEEVNALIARVRGALRETSGPA